MAKLSPDMLDPRNNLQYYTRSAIRNADVWTNAEVRKEYARLRDIAQKRLKRLAVDEPDSYAYKKNVGKYAPTRQLATEEVRDLLPELARFIAAKTGSVSGIRAQRAKAVAGLREAGYTGITKQNIKAFGQFMDDYRAQQLDRTYGSPEAVELFEFTEEHNIPWESIKDNFAQWLAQKKSLEKYVKKQNKAGYEVTSDMIIKEFDRVEEARRKRNERARAARQRKKQGGK